MVRCDMKTFTTTGVCTKENNYMVDITDRLVKMKAMVDAGNYFTVTRARQYGKTTTLNALYYYLQDDYIVINLSFEGIGDAGFSSEQTFVKAFCRKLKRETRAGLVIPDNIKIQIDDFLSRTEEQAQLDELFDTLYDWCYESEKEIVLFIDEVDSATNNQVFLDFLAQLRDGYLRRQSRGIPTFKSVILAGVTDIKSLKRKIRPDEAHKFNSPWNIAADFNIDMSLPVEGITGMLDEYENDHHTGMDTAKIAQEIFDYTSGYPFLVSRICQIIDTELNIWTVSGISEAVKRILLDFVFSSGTSFNPLNGIFPL